MKKITKLLHVADDVFKWVDLVNEHLNPCGDNLILLTLKGHLIIENLLEMNLVNLLAIEQLPEKAGRLGFKQKLQLVQAVVEQREPGPNADLFCAINKLNEIRNQLAHNLRNQQQIENNVRTFINEFHTKAGTKLGPDKALPTQLKSCIIQLAHFLAQIRFHFYKLEERKSR